MPPVSVDPKAEAALAHLATSDPVMARLIEEHGPVALTASEDYFFTLLVAIASQQLSSKAADTIVNRVKALLPDHNPPTAEGMLAVPDESLRGAGLSWGKVSYIKDLAERTASGRLPLDHIAQMEDEEAIQALVAVKGVGRWTAEMFLMFSMARPDVLAVDDYGLRAAVRDLYSLPDLPKPAAMRQIAEPWQPYRSYASLYLWKRRD